ncbi:hypothetical protein GQR58_007263 [Nymphon striatum]|nr:hypothetical protein GQR58_007263 [Nymphon striatum]
MHAIKSRLCDKYRYTPYYLSNVPLISFLIEVNKSSSVFPFSLNKKDVPICEIFQLHKSKFMMTDILELNGQKKVLYLNLKSFSDIFIWDPFLIGYTCLTTMNQKGKVYFFRPPYHVLTEYEVKPCTQPTSYSTLPSAYNICIGGSRVKGFVKPILKHTLYYLSFFVISFISLIIEGLRFYVITPNSNAFLEGKMIGKNQIFLKTRSYSNSS